MVRVAAAFVALAAATVLVWGGFAARSGPGVADREPLSSGALAERVSRPLAPVAVPGTVAPSTPAPPTTVPPPDASPVVAPPDIPVSSGLLSSFADPSISAPVAIRITSLAISSDVAPVGYDARSDQMEVPASPSLVGWYRHGPSPGGNGSAVLAAHVDWNGQRGAFYDLHSIQEGTIVTIEYDDGSVRSFEVFAARQYDKRVLPVDDIFAREGDPVLTLVTCGGLFDGVRRSYRDNIVVYARPAPSVVEAPIRAA